MFLDSYWYRGKW